MFRSLFYVLFMCYSAYRLCVFCVLYNCHRVSAHLQFNNNNNNNNLVAGTTCRQKSVQHCVKHFIKLLDRF